MFIKVCGLSDPDQVNQLDGQVDYIGFIFYPASKRYVEIPPKSDKSRRVGVFVDELIETIHETIAAHALDVIQLHGDENPNRCRELQKKATVIKSFGLHQHFDFKTLIPFEGCVDYFLFDTKSTLKGGSGIQFDWSVLNRYHLSTPFILSGGIGADSVHQIKKMDHPKLVGIDLNSRFEISPGIKDIKRIKTFINELQK